MTLMILTMSDIFYLQFVSCWKELLVTVAMSYAAVYKYVSK